MNLDKLLESLDRFGRTLPILVNGISDDDAAWRPASGNWSILEVVSHLVDEEVEDFRPRVFSALEDPRRSWPAIDPVGWATQRDYNSRQLGEQVQRFVEERRKSLRMLREIDEPNWENCYQHPELGGLHAGDLMSAWASHDQLHARQITKRKFEMVQRDAGNFSTRYAGDWTA